MPDLLLRETNREELISEVAAAVVEKLESVLQQARTPIAVDGDEIAELFGVSRATVDRYPDLFPSVMLGRCRRYIVDDVRQAHAKRKESNSDE